MGRKNLVYSLQRVFSFHRGHIPKRKFNSASRNGVFFSYYGNFIVRELNGVPSGGVLPDETAVLGRERLEFNGIVKTATVGFVQAVRTAVGNPDAWNVDVVQGSVEFPFLEGVQMNFEIFRNLGIVDFEKS